MLKAYRPDLTDRKWRYAQWVKISVEILTELRIFALYGKIVEEKMLLS